MSPAHRAVVGAYAAVMLAGGLGFSALRTDARDHRKIDCGQDVKRWDALTLLNESFPLNAPPAGSDPALREWIGRRNAAAAARKIEVRTALGPRPVCG